MAINVVLDTNVIIDLLDEERPEHGTAGVLIDRILAADGALRLAATSLKDLYYVLSRCGGEPLARRAVEAVMATMTILPVDDECCHRALRGSEPDFEDGLVRAAAEIARADYLVTRDRRAFAGSRVPRISPADLLRELGG